MSDRPMRLKYLTKMKIILCIFLLCITAVSVFGEPQELNGILGESVKFPAAVKIEGNLIHSGATIGDVISGRFTPPRNVEYSDRVHWDSSTGLFSLSELRLKDSGIYTVQDTQQTSVSTFNLTVWEDNVPVLKPHVSITRNEYPCTIECIAERGTEATLSWYREGQTKPYVSSPIRNAPYLDLPVPVERSGTYTCEARNSVSNEKASITMGDHCTAPSSPNALAILFGIIAVVAVQIAVVLAVLYHRVREKKRAAKSKLEGVREKKRVTKRILEDTRSELEGVREKKRAAKSKLKDTRSKLEDTRSKLEDTRSKLEAYIKSIQDQLNIEVQPSSSDYTRSKLEDTRSELEDTRSELEDTRSKLEDTRSELEDTRSELEDNRSELEVVGSSFIELIHGLASQDTKSELKDNQPLLQDVRDFFFHRNAPNVMASFPQTA